MIFKHFPTNPNANWTYGQHIKNCDTAPLNSVLHSLLPTLAYLGTLTVCISSPLAASASTVNHQSNIGTVLATTVNSQLQSTE